MDIAIVPRRACPTLAEPMRTGDGFLARLPPLLRPLNPTELAGIAAAATVHGNGLVEISKRGNLQIRGVTETGGPALAEGLARLGLDLQAGIPVSVDPLTDPDTLPVDPRGFAASLQDRLGSTGLSARLAPKLAIVLDFGTAFRPSGLPADLRFRFAADRADIGLGGDDKSARWIGSVVKDHVVGAACAILQCLAEFGPQARLAGSSRIAATDRFLDAVEKIQSFWTVTSAAPPAISDLRTVHSAEGVAAIAFPFGQASTPDLMRLAEMANAAGISSIAPAPERVLLFGRSAGGVAAIRDSAASMGFVVDPRDPRQSIFACIGSAGCASGYLPTRTIAAELAAAAPTLLDGSFDLHLSGCAKGCAHAEAAPITLAAIDKSLTIVLEGRAREPARGIVPANDLPRRLAALAAEVEERRREGEASASVLKRMGARRIEAVLCGTEAGGALENGRGIDGREPPAREPKLRKPRLPA